MTAAQGVRTFVVERSGVRLDKLVAERTGCGRRQAREMIGRGLVCVDGRRLPAGATPPRGASVALLPVPAAATCDPPAARPRVLAHIGGLLVLDKPAGLHCHHGRSSNTVAGFLEERYGSLAAVGDRPQEAGIAHRLDRDTSGVLLAATTRAVFSDLRACFGAGKTRKWYLALVAGKVAAAATTERALARRRSRVVAARRGDRRLAAVTSIYPLDSGEDWSLIIAEMSTGAPHQIRAHMAMLAHPLIGDLDYGGPPAPPGSRPGHRLHALRVRIESAGIDASCPPAADFVETYAALRSAGPSADS